MPSLRRTATTVVAAVACAALVSGASGRGFAPLALRFDAPARLDVDPHAFTGFSFAPDGRTLVGSTPGGLGSLVLAASGSGPRSLTSVGDGQRAALPAYSPDGARLAFVRVDTQDNSTAALTVLDGRTGARTDAETGTQIVTPAFPLRPVQWLDDRTLLSAELGADGHVHVYAVPTAGGTRRQLTPDGTDVFAPSTGGGRIAYESWSGSGVDEGVDPPALHVMDADGSHDRTLVRALHDGFQPTPAISPDGTRVAVGSDDGRSLCIVDVDSGTRHCVATPTTVESGAAYPLGVGDAVWSPDGRLLAYVTWGDPQTLFVVPADGSAAPVEVAEVPVFAQVAWSPDGRMLVYESLGDRAGLYAVPLA